MAEVFQYIGQTVSNATQAYVAPAAADLITSLQLFALVAVSLYIMLQGFLLAAGAMPSPFMTVLKNAFKIVFINAIALSADNYGYYVVQAIGGLESRLADALNVDSAATTSIYQVIDATLTRGLEIAAECLQNADNTSWRDFGQLFGWWLCALVVAGGTMLVVVLGGANIILAKFAIAIMFSVGPLFILLLIFPATSRFFDAWFSQVINYTLLVVIMAVIMSFAMVAFDNFVGGANFQGIDDINPMFAAGEIFVLSFVLNRLIKEAAGMASGLAGGMAIGAVTLSQLLSPLRRPAQAINPKSTRRDLQSGMQSTAGRLNHLAAGNTVLNPAYSQHLMRQMGKNWGLSKGGKVRE